MWKRRFSLDQLAEHARLRIAPGLPLPESSKATVKGSRRYQKMYTSDLPEIERLFADGMNVNAIARHLGFCRVSVWFVLKRKHGATALDRRKRLTPEIAAVLLECKAAGLTLRETGRRAGISAMTARNWLKRLKKISVA